MSDVRHCDGPDCTITAPLDPDEPRAFSERVAQHFIVVELNRYPHGKRHFHDQQCLSNWTKEETRAKR